MVFAKSLFVRRHNLVHLSQFHFPLDRKKKKRSDEGSLIVNAKHFSVGAGGEEISFLSCSERGRWRSGGEPN